MLVLMRRPGESIEIGDDITIYVVDIYRGQVRIGVRAPREVPVDRTEVAERKRAGIPGPRARA